MRYVLAVCVLSVLLVSASADNSGYEGYVGLIEPSRTVQVSAVVDGVIESIDVDRGDFVAVDQVLVNLESSVQRATYEIAKARAEMKAELEQQEIRLSLLARTNDKDEELHKRGILSEQDIFESRAERKLAEAAVLRAKETMRLNELERDRAQVLLDLRSIQSPIDGVVVDRLLSEGEMVNERVILSVASIDPLHVEVIASVEDMKSVKVGARGTVIPEEPFAGQYEAKVTVVDRVIDAASGTFRIRLELPNPGGKIPAGLKCMVHFEGN